MFNKLFCCLVSNNKNESEIEQRLIPDENQNKYILFDTTEPETPNPILAYNIYDQINIFLLSQNYTELSKINIENVHDYIYNILSIDHFINWSIQGNFIIKYYECLINNIENKDSNKRSLINAVVSKLITLFMFFNTEYNLNDYISFLKTNKFLFNSNLWLELLLNPYYDSFHSDLKTFDNVKLNVTLQLAKNIILPLYQPIQYYNLDYNMFEYIILGKTTVNIIDNNKVVCFNRFFDLESIKYFISQVYSGIFINQKLVNSLNYINNVDSKELSLLYVDTVIKLLVNKNNLYQM